MAAQLWQRDQDGQVCVNATALADAAHKLHGAAWLGATRGEMPGGLIGRLQAGGVTRKARAGVDAALAGHPGYACSYSQVVGVGARLALDARPICSR